MSVFKNKKEKKRKEITKISGPIKLVLKLMFNKFGYVKSLEAVGKMNEPTFNEKELMCQYLKELNEN